VRAEWGRAEGKVCNETLGLSAVHPEPLALTERTWFDLASLTKPLATTTLALLAFRSKILRPRTRVGEVLGEVQGSAVGDLEVDALLTHTSGLPAWLPLYCLAEGRPGLLPARLADVALDARPGERVVYSCVGYVLLGLVLERVAGEGLDSLFRREVAAPLGLEGELGFKPESDTHLLVGGALEPVVERRITRELGFDAAWIPPCDVGLADDGNARFLGGVAGNAGLFGTANGVFNLAAEYLPGDGALLTDAECALATRLRTGGGEQERGWGWQLASSPSCSAGRGLSARSFGHTGFTGTSVWGEPETRKIYVLLTNRNHPGQRENDLHPLRRRFHLLARTAVSES
jgi:CubicO group peptidase (beta-lactamase class C family)